MKIYFVTSDIHGFFNELKTALDNNGFDINNEDHILIICGDAFDRGNQAFELFEFIYDLSKQDRLTYIRGNHEDLLMDCLEQLISCQRISYHHITNGTLSTISQFTGINSYDLQCGFYSVDDLNRRITPFVNFINKKTINYFSLYDYVFVHGWVPYILEKDKIRIDLDAEDFMWKNARWDNGMLDWKNGITIKDKTIVCGHWHTSFGNFRYHNKGSGEFTDDACFDVFEDKGIIALDACTAHTHKINIFKVFEKLC